MANPKQVILPLNAAPQPRPPKADWRVEVRRLGCHARLLANWWLKPHSPYQPVFVLATTRTGSNLLISYLRQLEGVDSQSEVLCHVDAWGPRSERLPTHKAVRHIRQSLHMLTTPIRGCKLMLYQLASCSLSPVDLRSAFPTAKFVVLYRQSLIEQFVSKKLAWATNQFMLVPGQTQKQVQVTIDPAELRKYCEATRRAYHELLAHSWLAERSVLLSYEELTSDTSGCLEREICPLLGVPAVQPQTYICKQNLLPLTERVANYREVAGMLASPLCQQRYAWPRSQHRQRRAAA